MKILAFGSTGGTGREIVAQGLEQGHEVTAFARSPDKLGLSHERLPAQMEPPPGLPYHDLDHVRKRTYATGAGQRVLAESQQGVR